MKVTKADRQVMRSAAAVLSSYAQLIFESEVGRSGEHKGKVSDQRIADEIAEYRGIAKHLRTMARRTR